MIRDPAPRSSTLRATLAVAATRIFGNDRVVVEV
jgi:hypothetical protein